MSSTEPNRMSASADLAARLDRMNRNGPRALVMLCERLDVTATRAERPA